MLADHETVELISITHTCIVSTVLQYRSEDGISGNPQQPVNDASSVTFTSSLWGLRLVSQLECVLR